MTGLINALETRVMLPGYVFLLIPLIVYLINQLSTFGIRRPARGAPGSKPAPRTRPESNPYPPPIPPKSSNSEFDIDRAASLRLGIERVAKILESRTSCMVDDRVSEMLEAHLVELLRLHRQLHGSLSVLSEDVRMTGPEPAKSH